jgi:hypothetical protein
MPVVKVESAAAPWVGTNRKMSTNQKTTKKVFAEYTQTSSFEIPSDVQEYDIRWDTLTYTDKDGNEVEVESDLAGGDTHEMFHRPSDTYEEFEKPDEPSEAFFKYFDDMKKFELIEMLWNRMKYSEIQEILKERWLGAAASDNDTSEDKDSQ